MSLYRVGQILYLLSNKNTRVFPSRVIEEIIRNTLNGKNVDYLIQLPDKDETIASLSELSVVPFSSIGDLRNHMVENAKASIESMVENAVQSAQTIYGETGNIESSEEKEETVEATVKETVEKKDKKPKSLKKEEKQFMNIKLQDGKKARIKIDNLQKLGIQ